MNKPLETFGLRNILLHCNESVQIMEVCNGNQNFDIAEVVDPYGLPYDRPPNVTPALLQLSAQASQG